MGVDPATMAIKVALTAAQMAMTMSQKIKGPRLKSRDVTTADFGAPLERFWGIRRLAGRPIIHAEKLREKKVTSKTKGGKYSDYKYFGTFAVAVADHEIDSISRIWMDKHLVFDMTSTGPISVLGGFFEGLSDAPVKLTQGRNMRIYLGTEDQGIDPRYEEWCEDRYGPDTATAYRGVAYIFFEDIPLEKFGNRIPQIDVEAINNSSDNYLYATEAIDGSAGALLFAPDFSRFYADGFIWDTATRTRLYATPTEPSTLGIGGRYYRLNNTHTPNPTLVVYNEGGGIESETVSAFSFGQVHAFRSGRVLLGSSVGFGSLVGVFAGNAITAIDVPFTPNAFAEDSDGNVWAAGVEPGLSPDTLIYLECVAGARVGDATTIDTGSADNPGLYINASDEFVLSQAGTWYRLDNDLNLVQTVALTDSGTKTYAPGSNQLWRVASTTVTEINMANLTNVRTLSQSLWSGAPSINDGRYDPINHAILSPPSGSLTWRFLDRVGSNGVDLGDVVSDVAEWCGIASVDVSDLDQLVTGYSVVQGTGKDMIAPLLDIHDVDARPHDFGLQFLTRGNASLGTIPGSEFVREGDEPRYRITIAQDTDLPRQITLSFADWDHDQQTNTVVAQRPLDAVDAVRTQQIDLTTYVGTPNDMQKVLDRYFRSQWNRREKVENGLTAQYLGIEPADVYTLTLDGVTWTGKVEKVTLTQGRVAVEWARDETGLHTLGSGTGAGLDARDEDTIFVSDPTKGFVLDMPLVQDADDLTLPQLYYAAGDYGAGNWPGGIIYEADLDTDEYFAWNAVEPADKATWGYATEAMDEGVLYIWNYGYTLNVTSNAALTSCTEADIESNPLTNMAALGDEYINFTTATLQADGSYTLTGFLRGRRGTEWAMADHAVGDEFVLVSDFAREGMGLSEVGSDFTFKAQSVGRDVTTAPSIELTFAGNTLKPYAPANLAGTRNAGTGDWTFTWDRRNRLGRIFAGSALPMSETTESYELVIPTSGSDRTITASSATAVWTSAMQTADYGSPQSTLPAGIDVYQMSAAVGRGFANTL